MRKDMVSLRIDLWRAVQEKKRRRRRKGGGSEAVTVEPDRPRLGEGGAAAALEFDDRP